MNKSADNDFDLSLLDYKLENINSRKKIENYIPKFHAFISSLCLEKNDLKDISKLINITQIYINYLPNIKKIISLIDKFYLNKNDKEYVKNLLDLIKTTYQPQGDTKIKNYNESTVNIIDIPKTLKLSDNYFIINSHTQAFINIYNHYLIFVNKNRSKEKFIIPLSGLHEFNFNEKSFFKNIFNFQKKMYQTLRKDIKQKAELQNEILLKKLEKEGEK